MNNVVNISNEALEDFLKGDLGDFLESTKSIERAAEKMELAQASGEGTPVAVTQALESFLQRGASVLETMEIYCNNMPDAESVQAFSSLMNSMGSAINKIAALYKTEQAHRNRIELEEKKHELRMKELEYKERMRARAKDNGENPIESDDDSETMVEVNTASIVKELIKAKKNN